MRIQILSDLHIEAAPYHPQPTQADVIVLAGDIGNGVAALDWARQAWPQQEIIFVPGNHEYYGGLWPDAAQAMRGRAQQLGIHFLDQDRLRLGSVDFLGATLWTDFAIYESAPSHCPSWSVEEAMQQSQASMADYRAIMQVGSAGELRPLEPKDLAQAHAQARRWLDQSLKASDAEFRCVIPHHLPHYDSVSPRFDAAPTNPSFVSRHLVVNSFRRQNECR